MIKRVLMMLFVAVITLCGYLHADQKPDDREALAGLSSAKVIFDVRVADQEKLVFNLKLINETYEGLLSQGIKPKMVIAFRGPGVKLLSSGVIDEEALSLVRDLKKKGVRI